jgi:DNA (cytosine-5)-methyltransferase 1
MRALDLFAGIGWGVAGAVLGIHEDGVEIMPEARDTRTALNLATIHDDVSTLPDDAADGYDLLIASPPCQTFSQAGRGSGRSHLTEARRRADDLIMTGHLDRSGGDPRTWLILEPLRLCTTTLPTYIAWEQVPTVQPFWDYSADILRSYDYSVWTGSLQAEQYGVPQTRTRSFLIARRDGQQAAPPRVTHSRFHLRDPYRLDPDVAGWVAMNAVLDLADYDLYLSAKTSKATLRRLDQPAPTILTGHATAERRWRRHDGTFTRVSVEDTAVLQSFPPSLPYQGGKLKQYLQIGNAVPPRLAEAVLSAFIPAALPVRHHTPIPTG